MEFTIGTKIVYTSAAGTRNAEIVGIKIGPTAKPNFLNTWFTLLVPLQKGVKHEHNVTICGDNNSIKMFKMSAITA